MTRDEMIEKLEGVLYALMAPVEKRGLMSARSLTNDVLAALRAPAVTGEAHQTGPQPTACGGAAAMPISGPERPGESVKYPLNERGTPEDVTAGETAPYTAPPAAGAPPAPGWPDGNNAVRWKPASGCINCGEANDGGFYTSEGQVGGFCSQCWEFLRAEFSEVSVGAPPALVALVQRWQKARLALRDAEDREAYSMAEQLLDIHERALLAWSPAPAPVAPPAEDEPQCAGPFVSAFDCPKCDPRRHQPAPPVEVGDYVDLDGFGLCYVPKPEAARLFSQGNDGLKAVYRRIWQRKETDRG